jgi:hypothetical protein
VRGGAACLGAGGDGGGQARDSSPLPRCALWEPPPRGGHARDAISTAGSHARDVISAAGSYAETFNPCDASPNRRRYADEDGERARCGSRFEVAVAAVPYFPHRRVGSWHDSSQVLEHRRCHLWLCGRTGSVVCLCRPRLQKSYRGSTVSGYCGVRDEGCPGLIEAIIEKKRRMISKLARRTRPPAALALRNRIAFPRIPHIAVSPPHTSTSYS